MQILEDRAVCVRVEWWWGGLRYLWGTNWGWSHQVKLVGYFEERGVHTSCLHPLGAKEQWLPRVGEHTASA